MQNGGNAAVPMMVMVGMLPNCVRNWHVMVVRSVRRSTCGAARQDDNKGCGQPDQFMKNKLH
jgi:hypothetical protein